MAQQRVSFPAKLNELGDRSIDRLARVGASYAFADHLRRDCADPFGGEKLAELARLNDIEHVEE